MNGRDWLAAGAVVGGVALVALGVVGLLGGDDAAAPTASASGVTTTASSAPTSTTTAAVPDPTATSTTDSMPTSTTGAAPSTTTVATSTTTTTAPPAPAETVEEFIAAFDSALAAGDLDFLYDRLHPASLQIGGADTCRAYVDTEFAAASALALRGVVTGPDLVTKDGPSGPIEVPDRYTAEVALTFRGQVFDLVAEYALVDDQMTWLTNCA